MGVPQRGFTSSSIFFGGEATIYAKSFLANCSFEAAFGMQHFRDIRKFQQVGDLCQP